MKAGQLLADRFQIGEQLSKSAAGDLYLALDVKTNEPVVIKLLRPSAGDANEFLTRLLQEVKLLRRLDHPNAVRVIDANSTADNSFYVAMEYLGGKTVAQLVAEQGPLPPEGVATLLDQLARVLDEAHQLGIIHRDIKPQNLMVMADAEGKPMVKLLGFTFAKVYGGDGAKAQQQVTQAGIAIGTPSCMSPEQALGKRLTKLSDIYSTGVTLFYALTGHYPFEEKTELQKMLAHVKKSTPSFAEKNPSLHVPQGVEAVVRWAMAKEVIDRPPSAAELAAAFREAIAFPDRIPEKVRKLTDRPLSGSSTSTVEMTALTTGAEKRVPMWAMIAVVAVVAAALATTLALVMR
jgi:serine/threonine-protein kinase